MLARAGWTAGLAGLLLLALAPRATAEDQEKRFTWHPSLLVTSVADDNPELEEDEDATLGAWVSPRVELGYRAETFDVDAELGADLRRYLDESSLSEEFWWVGGSGEVGILPGLSLRVRDSWAPRPELVAAPPDETENLVQTNRLDVELRHWQEISDRAELLMVLRGTHFTGERFDATLLTDEGGVVINDDFRPSHWEVTAISEFQMPATFLGERTSTYTRGELRYRSFDAAAVTDHRELSVVGGLRSRRFRNVEIDLNAGWGSITFDRRRNVDRFVGEGSVRYRLPDGWTWRVSAANRFVADISGNNFVETTGRMGVQKFFGELTSVTAAVFVSRLENDAWGTDPNWFGGAELRIRRRLTRHLEGAVTYRYWRNAGDFEVDDFRQNRVALELTFRR